MSPDKPRLSIVAPVFTGETETVRFAANVLSESARSAVGESFELVFADDGSDELARLAMRDLAARDPRIRLIGDGAHHGLGAIVRWGIREARGEYILYTDGDGQVACRELAEAWPKRDDYDIIVGYRTERREGPLRRAGTALLSWATRPLFGRRIRDVDCAFKMGSADFFRRMNLTCRGTGIDAEIMLRAARRKARICQIPVRHTPPSGRKSRVTFGRLLYGTGEFLSVIWKHP